MSSAKYRRFHRVYSEGQKGLSTVLNAASQTLKHFGCASGDEDTFEEQLRGALITLLTASEDEAPLNQLKVEGTTEDKRRVLVREVISSFGGDEADTRLITTMILNADPHIVAVGIFSNQPMIRMDYRWREINRRLRQMFSHACDLYQRIQRMLADINQPWKGGEAGVDQTIALLKKYPDVAEPIYVAAQMTGIASYPPVENGKYMNPEARAFKKDCDHEVAVERRWQILKIAGLIVVGIAATVITVATWGTTAGIFVGVGIGLVAGGYNVYQAHQNLGHTKDAAALGLASPERVKYAVGEVQGAYAMLVIDVVTAGALARFGGSKSISGLMRLTRVTVISGSAGGLSMAVNPNTWRSENTGGLILFGIVLGAATGAVGEGIGAGLGRAFRPRGTQIQIGVAKTEGSLEVGNTVKVCVSGGDVPVPAKVLQVNLTDDTIMLEIEGTKTLIKVGRVGKLTGEVFSRENQLKGLRPVQDADLEGVTMREAYFVKDTVPQHGDIIPGKNGEVLFVPRGKDNAFAAKLSDIRIVDAKLHAEAAGVRVQDLEALQVHRSDHQFHPTRGSDGGYFTTYGRNGRLRIIPGRSRDSKGAFSGWADEPLPGLINMRGRGSVPAPEEIAVFMGHGSARGFQAFRTRQAARAMADAIVRANRTPGRPQIKATLLSSCQQGCKRWLLVGKTNAQEFQEQLNMRLRELGIDPGGPQGITVLAMERPGSLYGADTTRVFGRFQQAEFVPAVTQGKPAYPISNLAAQWPEALILTEVVMFAGGGMLAIRVAEQRDPGVVMRVLAEHADNVLGYVFEARQPKATTLQLRAAGQN